MEERLRYILATVNEWLKFAEAKNGALLVADIAVLVGIFSLQSEPAGHRVLVQLSIPLLIASGTSSLVSYIPQMRALSYPSKKGAQKRSNLLFYGHIAEHDPQSYIETLYAESGGAPSNVTPIEVGYAEQIITNSRIAVKKYRCFRVGLWLTILALLLLLAESVMSIIAV